MGKKRREMVLGKDYKEKRLMTSLFTDFMNREFLDFSVKKLRWWVEK